MRLATISGVNGVFTADDIARIRALALERRGEAPPARRAAKSAATSKSTTTSESTTAPQTGQRTG